MYHVYKIRKRKISHNGASLTSNNKTRPTRGTKIGPLITSQRKSKTIDLIQKIQPTPSDRRTDLTQT